MSLSIKALAIAGGVMVGGSWLAIGLVNLAAPDYGIAFLSLAASIYPGYHGPAGLGSVMVATLYGLVDGAVGGAVLAWLYNRVTGRTR